MDVDLSKQQEAIDELHEDLIKALRTAHVKLRAAGVKYPDTVDLMGERMQRTLEGDWGLHG